ncbi:MAG: class I SAM-dependent methyltransferase [Streptosporangiaceae bacterium]
MRHTPGHHAHAGHAATGKNKGKEVWLAATWPFVRDQLPSPPASVIEVGCGPLGGHVPSLLRAGYQAIGVDPEAPAAPEDPEAPETRSPYRRIAFEDYRPDALADAVIASVSLHHMHDLGAALDHVAGLLVPGGMLVVIEWISEDMDGRTARWCFRHHPRGPEDPNDPDDPGSWLAGMQADWTASGLPWDDYFRARLEEHSMHPASVIRRELATRFATVHLSTGPYYFPDLLDADEQAEQAAIDSGDINPGRLRYAGKK